MPARPFSLTCTLLTALGLVAVSTGTCRADDAKTDFEKNVRPLLATHCIECHGPKKQEAGLRLDHGTFIAKGSDYGPAVVPGKPQESRLVEVLKHDELDIQMPPKGKLDAASIDTLHRWVRQGAFWPEEPLPGAGSAADPETHWAFQPIRNPVPPSVGAPDRTRTPIDRFVLSRLEGEGLTFSAPADRPTLIRRLSFDLRGIPPTIEEVRRFAADPQPDAFERLVERYLASPEYGERWGRYWLDIARYADTKGYVFTEERRYPFAWTYRNYIIDSLNADLPYDQFILEQLAADRLGLPENHESLAALGFLTVGKRFRNSQPDIIDDRIDVTTRGLMGITVSCARCHDHKFDPIPTADYYSLYGVFQSTVEPDRLPVLGTPADTPEHREFLAKSKEFTDRIEGIKREEAGKVLNVFRARTQDFLVRAVEVSRAPKNAERPEYSGPKDVPRGEVVNRWRQYFTRTIKPDHPVFGPWKILFEQPDDNYSQVTTDLLNRWRGHDKYNPRVIETLSAKPLANRYDLAVAYGSLLQQVHTEWVAHRKQAPQATALPDANAEQIRRELYAEGTPFSLSTDEAVRFVDRKARNRIRGEEKKFDGYVVNAKNGPARAMTVADREMPIEPVIFVRGNIGRRGDRVPRRFPQFLDEVRSEPFTNGSGRLELAESIVAPENPLTARVLVNRVWRHHFGTGLVTTMDDFGVQADPPSHPELLDHLASELIRSGWSLKHLHRSILLSTTWRQSSLRRANAAEIDPENRLYWRQNRRRLDFEAMRDSLMAVTGELRSVQGQRPVQHTSGEALGLRSVYLLVDRNNVPNLFRTFDVASPDQTTAERPLTTVPQQALFAMNSPFVIDLSRRALLHADVHGVAKPAAKITRLFHTILQRNPTPVELAAAVEFIKIPASDPNFGPLPQLAQALLLSNEFHFTD